jgi:hypothetical protein
MAGGTAPEGCGYGLSTGVLRCPAAPVPLRVVL